MTAISVSWNTLKHTHTHTTNTHMQAHIHSISISNRYNTSFCWRISLEVHYRISAQTNKQQCYNWQLIPSTVCVFVCVERSPLGFFYVWVWGGVCFLVFQKNPLFLPSIVALVLTAKQNPMNTGQHISNTHSITVLFWHLLDKSMANCFVFVFKHVKTPNKTKHLSSSLSNPNYTKVSVSSRQAYRQRTHFTEELQVIYLLCFSTCFQQIYRWGNHEHPEDLCTCIASFSERIKYIYLSINICKSIIQYIRVFEKKRLCFILGHYASSV